jgi:hypothetical protein
MKQQTVSKLGTMMFAVVMAALSTATYAEKGKFTYTKELGSRQTLTSQKVYPGDVAGHEMEQAIQADKYTTTDREYQGATGLISDHSDSVNGTGIHRGTAIDTLKNGDKVFWKYSGQHKTTMKADGAWETTGEGMADITGGTGKYKNAKGKSPYRFKASPEGYFEEGVQEWEF